MYTTTIVPTGEHQNGNNDCISFTTEPGEWSLHLSCERRGLDCRLIEKSSSRIPAKCPCPKRLVIMVCVHSAFSFTKNYQQASVHHPVNAFICWKQGGRQICRAKEYTPSRRSKTSLLEINDYACYNGHTFMPKIMQVLLRLLYKHHYPHTHIAHSMLSGHTFCTSLLYILIQTLGPHAFDIGQRLKKQLHIRVPCKIPLVS